MSWLKGHGRLSSKTLRSRQFYRFQSNGNSAPTVSDETEWSRMRDAVDKLSFMNPERKSDSSPEMREKLSTEFDNFLKEFVGDVDRSSYDAQRAAERFSGPRSSTFGDMFEEASSKFRMKFNRVNPTDINEPYSVPEMYVRQLFHARRIANMGAEIAPGSVYKPHEDLHNPKPIQETGISTSLAAGAHLGHATSRLRANCLPYIYGIREGIHIIDSQQTLANLRRVSRVAEEIARRGGSSSFVSTRPGQKRTVEKAAKRSRGYYVGDRWVPGTLTNYLKITESKTDLMSGSRGLEINMADNPTGRELSDSLQDTIVKPDLVVILNPVENRTLLAECARSRIPTTGIVDTDSEPSSLTYPVPGNDDSLRFGDLFAGVLSMAAKQGREVRSRDFDEVQKAKESSSQGAAFNSSTEADDAAVPKDEVTESERESMK